MGEFRHHLLVGDYSLDGSERLHPMERRATTRNPRPAPPQPGDDRPVVGEAADYVGATADLLLRRSWGLLDQSCRQCSWGEGGDGEQVGPGLVGEPGRLSEALLELLHHRWCWICTASALA
ncbi:MAG TPA: hypothetical protein VKY90_04905 [Candidatus Dormibacteraeota bacterium]|nr:hypothetical protein [Candidatus Dormibacteraeota bacterium]